MKPRMLTVLGACVATAGLILSPNMAFAGTPTIAPQVTPPTTDGGPSQSQERVKVMVVLDAPHGQVLNEQASLNEVNNRLAQWIPKYNLKVARKFGHLLKGFSAWIDADNIGALKNEPGVVAVEQIRVYEPTMGTAGDLTQSTQARTDYGLDGRGLVVSVIDTGIDIHHQDMKIDADVKSADKLQPEAGFTDKVPYGYNFADNNNEVLDTAGSQHGMHVAGIIAANGGDSASVADNGRINGVAPNAQLLAMKVFSNDPETAAGAQADDIIAAIESSVEKGADIINMSLGSVNGHGGSDIGEQLAIAAAQSAGVQVIVAAGNDGLSTSANGTTADALGLLDNGSVGSPSTGDASLSVASVNNSAQVVPTATATISGENDTLKFAYSVSAGRIDDQSHKLVYAGLGKPDQVPDSVRGNYALIKRGELTFADKAKNAFDKGATGVVIFNHETGGNALIGMAGLEGVDKLVTSLGFEDGNKLATALQSGKDVSITFSAKKSPQPVPHSLEPSDFTSWGTTSELDFKPQIAGIGGSVYSTLNDNKYGMMSGTSMATPHVAGQFALLRQYYKDAFPDLDQVTRNAQLRTSLSNTAMVLENASGVPFAPRQMGAGLAQTENALRSRVFATVDGKAEVPLRQITGAETVTVTLNNTDSVDHTFTTGGTCVLNEKQERFQPITTECSSGDTMSASVVKVTVPAGGTATVDFTVTPDLSQGDHWVEGWFKLTSDGSKTSAGDTQPDLTLPYLGFAGDWNKEAIIDAPIYGGQSSVLRDVGLDAATALTTNNGRTLLTDGQTWISPNGDGKRDSVTPQVALLRNAKELNYEILDASGKHIADTGKTRDVSRSTVQRMLRSSPTELMYDGEWNGKIWNTKTGAFETAPEGQYTYRVKARLGKDFPWQTVDMTFGIDAKAPVVTEMSRADDNGTLTLTFSVDENGSGVDWAKVRVVDDKGKRYLANHKDGETTFTVEVPNADSVRYLKVNVPDNAGNSDAPVVFLGTTDVAVNGDNWGDEGSHWVASEDITTDGGSHSFTLTGAVTPDVKKVFVNGVEALVDENNRFTAMVPVVEGRNELKLDLRSEDDKSIGSWSDWLGVDLVKPVVTLEGTEADGTLKVENGKATLRGTITDDFAKVDGDKGHALSLSVGAIDAVALNSDGSFEKVVSIDPGQRSLLLLSSDGLNYGLDEVQLSGDGVGQANPSDALQILFDAPEFNGGLFGNGFGKRVNFVSQDRPYVVAHKDDEGATLTLSGAFNRVPKEFAIDGKAVPVAADGSFKFSVELVQGVTKVAYRVVDTDGTVVKEATWRYFYDRTAPGVNLEAPTISADGAVYRVSDDNPLEFKGIVWDNQFGYTLMLNSDKIETFENFQDSNEAREDVSKKAFTASVEGKDGDLIFFGRYDLFGNGVWQIIPVIKDDTAPTVRLEGLTDGKFVEPGSTKLKLVAEDAHLDDLDVKLTDSNGNDVFAKVVETKVVPATGAELAVEGDVDPDDSIIVTGGGSTTAAADAEEPKLSEAEVEAKAERDYAEVKAKAAAKQAPAVQTELTLEVPSSALTKGEYVLTTVSHDRAGNTGTLAQPLVVDAVPVIEGPDSITIDANADDWAAEIAKQYTVKDDQKPAPELEVNDVDVAALVEGEEHEVTLRAVDAEGRETTRVVKVTPRRAAATLTADCVTMTAGFAPGDKLSATCTTEQDGSVKVVVENELAEVEGTIAIQASNVSEVWVVENGERTHKVSFTVKDGAVTFTGSSKATYVLVPKPTDKGEDGTSPVIIHPGDGSGGDSGKDGSLTDTGAESPLGLATIAAGVLLAGAAALVFGRRRFGKRQ